MYLSRQFWLYSSSERSGPQFKYLIRPENPNPRLFIARGNEDLGSMQRSELLQGCKQCPPSHKILTLYTVSKASEETKIARKVLLEKENTLEMKNATRALINAIMFANR